MCAREETPCTIFFVWIFVKVGSDFNQKVLLGSAKAEASNHVMIARRVRNPIERSPSRQTGRIDKCFR